MKLILCKRNISNVFMQIIIIIIVMIIIIACSYTLWMVHQCCCVFVCAYGSQQGLCLVFTNGTLSLCVWRGGFKRWGSLNAFMATLVSRLHVCSWFVWFEAVNQTRPGPSVCVGGVDADARSRGPRDETRVHQDPEHS